MYIFQYILLFAGTLVAANLQKAAKYAKRSIVRIPTKDAPRAKKTSLFLNNKTASKYFII